METKQEIAPDFKAKIIEAIKQARPYYGGTDGAFAKSLDINAAAYSRINNGDTEEVISFAKWMSIGRKLGVRKSDRVWNTVRTEVYNKIENNLINCKDHAKSFILIDHAGIGKTFCARNIVRGMQNAFYIDCSQAKTKVAFIKLMAKTLGSPNKGRYFDVKEDLKYLMQNLHKPLIVLDEAGDLEYNAFLELKELWNAAEHNCGWYMMGAEGLRAKINRGMAGCKVGFTEIFSRYNNKFYQISPIGKENQERFYAKLIGDVLTGNMPEEKHKNIDKYIKQVMITSSSEVTGDLRRAETLVELEMAA